MIDIFKVKSINKGNPFRFNAINFDNAIYEFYASPSEYFFGLPEIGDYILGKVENKYPIGNYLLPLYKIDSLNEKNNYKTNYFDIHANVENLVYMDQGDMYFGKYARGYFNSNIFLYSDNYRSKLLLSDDGNLEIKSYNFKISSEDESISIFTKSSIPPEQYDEKSNTIPTFGDNLYIQFKDPQNNITSTHYSNDGGIETKILFKEDRGKSRFVFYPDGSVELYSGGVDYNAISSIKLSINDKKETFSTENIDFLVKKNIVFNCDSYKSNSQTFELNSDKNIKISSQNININGNAVNINNLMTASNSSVSIKSASIQALTVVNDMQLERATIGLGGAFYPGMPYIATLSIKINGVSYKIPLL